MTTKTTKRPVPVKRVVPSAKKSSVKAKAKKTPLLLRPLKHLRSKGFVKLPKDRKQWMLPLTFALVFGAIGAYFLVFSKAATSEAVYFRNYKMAPAKTGVAHVADPSVYPMDPTVIQLSSGATLAFDPPRPTFPILKKTCFMMRASLQGKTSRVEIVSWDKVIVVTAYDRYQEHCVVSQDLRDGTGKLYNARHVSGSPVNILYMVGYTTPSSDPSLPQNYAYATLVSDLAPGKVYACKSYQTIHMKADSTGGTVLSWWSDDNAATSKQIPANTTSYVGVEAVGTNFFAYVQNPTAGGHSPATLPIADLKACY